MSKVLLVLFLLVGDDRVESEHVGYTSAPTQVEAMATCVAQAEHVMKTGTHEHEGETLTVVGYLCVDHPTEPQPTEFEV